jgi:hypothetical protein
MAGSAQAVTYTAGTALPTGKLTSSVAVNQSTRDVYVASAGANVPLGPIAGEPGGFKRFSSAGAELGCALTPGPAGPEHPSGVAVNPLSGNFYVLTVSPTAAGNELRTYASGCGVELPASSGTATTVSGSSALGEVVATIGTGTLASGSKNVSGVTTSTGAFVVGQAIKGSGIPLGKGSGDVSAASGTGDLIQLATGNGDRTSGSAEITNLKEVEGTYAAGESVSGPGIPAGTTIVSCTPSCASPTGLTLSQPAESTGTGGKVFSGSKEVTGVSTTQGAFAVGQEIIEGISTGIPAGTTIVSCTPSCASPTALTLSNGAASADAGTTLTAGSKQVTNVSTESGSFVAGQTISGPGIKAGTTIAAVGAGTLTLSQRPAEGHAADPLNANVIVAALGPGTLELSVPAEASGAKSLSAGPQPLAVGEAIEGPGIPTGEATGTLTEGSPVITGVTLSGGCAVGQKITGAGLPSSVGTVVECGVGTIEITGTASRSGPVSLTLRTTVAAVGTGTFELTLSDAATASASGVAVSGKAFLVENSTAAPLVQPAADSVGNVYLPVRTANKLQKCTSYGACSDLITSGVGRPDSVALDAAGNIYLTSSSNNTFTCANNASVRLRKFKPNGEPYPEGGPVGAESVFAGLTSKATTVAVDKKAGNVYVGRGCQKETGVNSGEFNGPGGAKLTEFGSGSFAKSTNGNAIMNQLAVDETSHTVYAADPGHENVQVFKDESAKKTFSTTTGGTGTGAVRCNGTGAACLAEYDEGQEVILEAAPANGSKLKEWNGGTGSAASCNGSTAETCTFTLAANSSINAEFALLGKTLKIARNGPGLVESTAPASPKINCGSGAGCEAVFPEGEAVTLKAEPESSHALFTGWTTLGGNPGTCTGTTSPCQVTMAANVELEATFTHITHSLTVAPTGSGKVDAEASPAPASGSISGCEEAAGSCSATYNEPDTVTLVATPGTHFQFSGWGVGECKAEPAGKCEVEMSAAKTVHATFTPEPGQVSLTVNVSGEGQVKCNGTTCASAYAEGTSLSLESVPGPHANFQGWSGGTGSAVACTGTANCSFTINANSSVNAPFTPNQHTLTIAKSGTGDGSFECKTTGSFGACNPTYFDGTTITIKATADSHSTFAGWAGCSSTSGSECTVTAIAANTTVTATLDLAQRTLTIKKDGTGSGSVTCNGGVCAPAYADGTTITIEASADSSSTFTGFSGGCSGTGACKLTIKADTTVTATFSANPPSGGGGGSGGSGGAAPSNHVTLGTARPQGQSLSLQVTVPGPGTLSATGKGLKKASAGAAGLGAIALKLALTPQAKKKLKKKGKLKVKLTIVFTPTGGAPGTSTMTVTFKAKKGKAAR